MYQVGGNVAVKRGVTIGIGLAVLAGLVTGLYDAGVLPGIVQLLEFLVALGGFFAAGLLSGRDTRRIRAGVFAALIATDHVIRRRLPRLQRRACARVTGYVCA